MSILDQIANPRMADIAGALDIRQKRLEKDEEKRKEIRLGQLISQALPGIKKDSPLYEMARDHPREFSAVAKAFGIPLSDGERMQRFVDDTEVLYTLAQRDPKDAFDYALNLAEERRQSGQDTQQLDMFIDSVRNDPQAGMTSLFLTRKLLNRDEEIQDRKLDMESRALDIQEKRLSQDAVESSNQYLTPIQASNGVYAFDHRSGNMRLALDDNGNPVIAAQSDVDLQSNLTREKTKSKEQAQNTEKYKENLFESINSNSRMLNKYRFAIKQLDEGAETGPVINRLPNLREQSVLVDVIRKEIGMEILGSGLLGVNPTDRDVEFALATSIPDNLRPDALRREIQRRSDILEDLNTAQEEYYRLIDEEGFTKGDILKMAKQKRQSSPAGATPGIAPKEVTEKSNKDRIAELRERLKLNGSR